MKLYNPGDITFHKTAKDFDLPGEVHRKVLFYYENKSYSCKIQIIIIDPACKHMQLKIFAVLSLTIISVSDTMGLILLSLV